MYKILCICKIFLSGYQIYADTVMNELKNYCLNTLHYAFEHTNEVLDHFSTLFEYKLLKIIPI